LKSGERDKFEAALLAVSYLSDENHDVIEFLIKIQAL
jgi:hypothetical protein